jgi:hypothetical protein
MKIRVTLVVLLALVCAQATLKASTSYLFGTTNEISFAAGSTAYTAGVWAEDFSGTIGTTTQQIDCVVDFTTTTHTCGSPVTGNAKNIPISGEPTGTPGTAVNYVEVDGDPEFGAPISTTMSGLTIGDTYQISFYQASNEEGGVTATAFNDQWQVFVLPTTGEYICPVCSPVVDPGSVSPNFTSATMVNSGETSTPWVQQTFTFVANQTSEILEFVTDAVRADGSTPGPGNFGPPFLDVAGVTLTQQSSTPEPGTWMLTILGAGLMFAGRGLRRRKGK